MNVNKIQNVVTVDRISLADFPVLHPLRKNKNTARGKRDITYCKEVCAFDIETTTIEDIQQSVMYIWQFAIEDRVYIGRSWDDFKKFLSYLKIISNGNRLLCFVHNLSYEMQFLSGVFQFKNEDVFCTESRKILYSVLNDFIEFRCSYLLSNMSLDEMTKKYNVMHQKLSGAEFDYTKKRYSWTPLTDRELEYCVNDVLGLVESIHAIMSLYNDSLYTLPLTSTGFVRREVKRAMRPYHDTIQEIFPDMDVYRLLRAEFRGGNTHANRYYAGEVIRERGTSYDISSSYPSAQCNKEYPITPFKKVVNADARLIERLITRNRALIFQARFENIRLRDAYWGVPYIPIAKCISRINYVNDNGRILSASMVELAITDIDYRIIQAEYTWGSVEVVVMYKSNYGKLPQGIIDCNIEYFKAKTELKGIESQALYYMKSKNLLNAIYGMTCQNPTKELILFDDCLYNVDTSKSEEQLLLEAKKRAFVVYQFACWTTSHARDALEHGMRLCGDSLLYVDTDSCKCIGEKDFTAYNTEQKKLAEASGLYAEDKQGVVHHGGVYEFDGAFSSFCTLGAKKYCYEDIDGGLHLTVSGVGKNAGAQALKDAGGIEAFKPGFIFQKCGKTSSHYNDGNYGKYKIGGHELDITRNVVIKDDTYTLSITDDYDSVLKQSKQFLYKMGRLLESTKI